MQGWVGVWGRVGMWNTWFPLVATECLLPVREKTTLQREQDMRLWQYATSRAATYLFTTYAGKLQHTKNSLDPYGCKATTKQNTDF